MNARPLGALRHRKPVQRLIGTIMLLCCMIGLFAASLLFHPSSIAHADAQSVQTNRNDAAALIAQASSSQPNFGSSVYIFNPSMSQSTIQATVDMVANQQLSNQFGTQRDALLFEPGTYGSTTTPSTFRLVTTLPWPASASPRMMLSSTGPLTCTISASAPTTVPRS